MDFATLKTRLQEILGRAPAAVVYEMVTADVNNTLRLRAMEATATVTEAETVPLPTDYLDMVSVYRDSATRTALSPTTSDTLARIYQPTGTPATYAVENGQLRLSPAPAGSESLVMRYFAALPDLVADSDTNGVLDRYPQIYVYGSLAHHAGLMRDSEAASMWFPAYEKAKKQAELDETRFRSGAGPMVPKVGQVA